MSNMTVKVEFLLGTNMEDAIREAKQKCILWQVAYVEFDFNGWNIVVGSKCDVEDAYQEWLACRSSDKSFIFN